jgi:acyl-CoA synthetase (AMP-forming)/AMP-acid ligase II
LELLRQQADRYGDKVAFSFSRNGDDENVSRLSYRELDVKARAIAARLQHHGAAGERVLVVCRPGLEGIAGYFGCVYAGAVAVPVHERLAPRLSSVVPDSRAGVILAPPETPAKMKAAVDALDSGRALRWCLTDAPVDAADTWVHPDIDADTTAMLQYTSGSTKAPKGVVVKHRHLLHNVETIHQMWGGDDDDVIVSWLPQHHDMGLIGTSLHPLYLGCTTVLMAPGAFIKRPLRWLEAISRHRATGTVAPNFAYAKCVETSSADERAALDLSSLSTAMNGAEPVNAQTLRDFAEAFGAAGFRPEAFRPVYGLAEATLLVTGGSEQDTPVVAHLDRAALGHHRVVDAAAERPTTTAVVGCGRPRGGQRVVVVDPETRRAAGPDEVGEIWIAGSSVAGQYWQNPDETEQTFAAYLAGTGEGPFLRTGDLGFLRHGEVFITGRWKDLVLLGGRNYYPNDIELTVQDCHPALLAGRGAVFAGADKQLVVAQEVGRDSLGDTELDEIVATIQAALSRHHQIRAQTVVLVAPLCIPTTSSGKIQRSRCRQQFLDGELDTLAEWHAPAERQNRRTDMTVGELVSQVAKTRGPDAAAQLAERLTAAAARRSRPPGRTDTG